MADIELVIKMPEEQYNTIKSDLYNTFTAEMKKWGLRAIREGTPLPKGHGRLKDIDQIIRDGRSKGFCEWYDEMKYAPTIIEADKAESEEV